MATLSIGLDSGVVSGSREFTLSDANVTRWINAYRDVLHLPATASDAQVLAAWAREVIEETKRKVKDYEARIASNINIVEN